MMKKAVLDKETKELIGSSPAIIKQSLLKNMTDNNIVQYRRLIQKADEEIDEEAESAFRASLGAQGAERAGLEQTGEKDITQLAEEDAIDREQFDFSSSVEMGKFNKDYKAYKLLSDTVPILKDLAEKVVVIADSGASSNFETENDSAYNKITSEKDSNTIYNALKRLTANKDSLKDSPYYKEGQLVSPTPPRREREGQEVAGRPKKPIDVAKIEEALLPILEKESEGKSFIEIFKILHINRFKLLPAGDKKLGYLASLLTESKKQLLGVEDNKLVKVKESLGSLVEKIKLQREARNDIERSIEKLQELKNAGTLKSISIAFGELKQQLSSELNSTKLNPEKIKELRSKIGNLSVEDDDSGQMSYDRDTAATAIAEKVDREVKAELAKFKKIQSELVGFIEAEEDIVDIVNTINRFMKFPIPSKKEIKMYQDSMMQAQEDLKRRREQVGIGLDPEDKKQKGLLDVIEKVTSELSKLKELFTVKDKYLKEYTTAKNIVDSVGNGVDKIARSLVSINNIILAEEDGAPIYENINNQIIVSEVMSLLRAEISLSSLSSVAETDKVDVTQIKGLDAITDKDALKIQKLYDRMFIDLERVSEQREKISEAMENLQEANDEQNSINETIDEVEE